MKSLTALVSVAFVASALAGASARQVSPRPAVYAAAQATAGQPAYQANCASCHQPTLVGQNEAPPLAGANFMTTWSKRTTKDLLEYMSATMPPGNPSLSEAEYLNISAFILEFNGAPSGAQALTAATATPIGTIATGQRPTTTVATRPGGSGEGAPPATGRASAFTRPLARRRHQELRARDRRDAHEPAARRLVDGAT